MNTRKPRALFLVSSLTNGGLERVTLTLLSGLQTSPIEPALVVLSGTGDLHKDLPTGLRVVTLFPGGAPARFYKVALKAMWQLRTLARSSDILIGTCQPTHLLAKLLGAVYRKPALAWVHYVWGAQPLKGRMGTLLLYAYRKMRNYVFVSEMSKNLFTKGVFGEMLPGPTQAAVLPNPIQPREQASSTLAELDKFLKKHPDAEPVLFVGRLAPVKNTGDLIEAVFLLRKVNPSACLVIIGDGPLLKELQSEAGARAAEEYDNGMEPKQGYVPPVLFLGKDDNPLPVMRRIGTLALVSKWDSWPGVALEAMTEGCVVVAYAAPGGLSEMLQPSPEEKRGLLIEACTPEAMADGLSKALSEAPELENIRTKAKHYASTFSPEFSGRAWSAHLSNLITDKT